MRKGYRGALGVVHLPADRPRRSPRMEEGLRATSGGRRLQGLYVGVHYLSDVVFGGLLGYLVGLAMIYLGAEKWRKWK